MGLSQIDAWQFADRRCRDQMHRSGRWWRHRREARERREASEAAVTARLESAARHHVEWQRQTGAPDWVFPLGATGVPSGGLWKSCDAQEVMRAVRDSLRSATGRAAEFGGSLIRREVDLAAHRAAKDRASASVWPHLTELEHQAIEKFTECPSLSKRDRTPGATQQTSQMPFRAPMLSALGKATEIPALTLYRTEKLSPDRLARLRNLQAGETFSDWDDHVSTSVLPHAHFVGDAPNARIDKGLDRSTGSFELDRLSAVVFEGHVPLSGGVSRHHAGQWF